MEPLPAAGPGGKFFCGVGKSSNKLFIFPFSDALDSRLRWNYRPDSDLYLIYTAGQKFASLAAVTPQQFYEHRFVIKYTYSFRP